MKGSAGDFHYGPIDRQGNGRLRRQLVEAVWRLINTQAQWHALVKWKARLGTGKAMKKKTVAALADRATNPGRAGSESPESEVRP